MFHRRHITFQLLHNVYGPAKTFRHLLKITLPKSVGRQRQRAHADAPGVECLCVTQDNVLVSSNADQLQHALNPHPGNLVGGIEVHKNKVVICPTADNCVAPAL